MHGMEQCSYFIAMLLYESSWGKRRDARDSTNNDLADMDIAEQASKQASKQTSKHYDIKHVEAGLPIHPACLL
jgi:hypothetical protein